MPALILHLRQQRRLAPQGRRARDPVALRQHADDFGMRVLADLADQRAAIGLRHPVVRLDALLGIDARLEAVRGFAGVDGAGWGVECLTVHGYSGQKSGFIASRR